MRSYVLTTGVVFGLLTLAHLWRILEEGSRLMRDPFFVSITLIAGALCTWAVFVLRSSTRS